MARCCLTGLAFICVALCSAGTEAKGPRFMASSERDGILELDNENWDDRVNGAAVAIVAFSANWCKHCQALAPEYAAAARMVPEVVFGRVDVTKETADLSTKYEVRGYPHIKLFRFGHYSEDYEGPYTASALVSWVRRKSGPVVKELTNWTSARIFFGVDDDALRSGVGDDEDTNMVRAVAVSRDENELEQWTQSLEAVAKYIDDESVGLAVTLDPKLAGEDAFGLFLHSPFLEDDEKDETNWIQSIESTPVLVRAIEAATAPAVTIYDAYLSESIFKRGPAVHAVLFCEPNEDQITIAAFEEAAMKRRDRSRHVIVPSTEQRVFEHFDIDPNSELPALVLIDLRGKRHKDTQTNQSHFDTRTYRYPPGRFGPLSNKNNIIAFEDALLFADPNNMSLTPFLRSEPYDARRPNYQTFRDFSRQAKVLSLTGLTFESIVQASRSDRKDHTDFLVSFHAPWCVHSKALAAHLETIAERFKAVDSLVIASIDATKNEILLPGLIIRGFPTLVFFPADDPQSYHVYSGQRDQAAITAFLQNHATKALLVQDEPPLPSATQQRPPLPPDL